ncbi:MAG: aminotransferase class IV [Bacteroidetes bacterium]|nr:aminotransferase class IV [Bacteroidota bacterium]
MSVFLNFNGKLVNADEPLLKVDNRAFRFGDSLFETIRVMNGQPLFLSDHITRLLKGVGLLKMDLSPQYTLSFFLNQITELIKANNITAGGRIRITVFRNGEGFYTPKDNSTSYVIEVISIPENEYILNQKGFNIDIFSEIKKQQNPMSTIKSGNALLYVLAGAHKVKQQLDDCVVMNAKGDVIESINSNIFAVKNGVLYTPPVSEGCVDGVLRKKIIEVAFKNRIAVYEINLAQSVLLSADELFLTNVISGLRWVGAYKNKRYFNNTSKSLTDKLNEYVTKKVE